MIVALVQWAQGTSRDLIPLGHLDEASVLHQIFDEEGSVMVFEGPDRSDDDVAELATGLRAELHSTVNDFLADSDIEMAIAYGPDGSVDHIVHLGHCCECVHGSES